MRVQKTKCNQCLFSTSKIVSDSRKKDIIKNCAKDFHAGAIDNRVLVKKTMLDAPIKDELVN